MQIFDSNSDFFAQNPNELKLTLRDYRTRGLTEAQAKNIPVEDMINIDQANRTIALSMQLGRFFDLD